MKTLNAILGASLLAAVGCGGGDVAQGDGALTSGDEARGASAPVAETGGGDSQAAAGASSTPGPAAPPEQAPEWVSTRNPNARYLVAVGIPTAHDDSVSADHVVLARRHAAESVLAVDGVELAPPHFSHTDFEAHLGGRELAGYFLECAILHHDVDARGTHFAVSVAVVRLGTEAVVATLQGRATAPGPTSSDSELLALEGALDSALRGLPRVLGTLH